MTETTTETTTENQVMTKREQLIEQTKNDGRQLVSVRRIDDLIPIPGADRIQTAMVGGWPVVVKVGEFQVGQMGVFFEVDSFLNHEDERYAFLAQKRVVMNVEGQEIVKVEDISTEWNGIKGVRLKSVKLRKQLSQGLLLPLEMFPEIATRGADDGWDIRVPDETLSIVSAEYNDDDAYDVIRKLNFTTVLGVIKWEKIERSSGGVNIGKQAGNFPTFLRKSDQTRCQNLNQEIFGYEQRVVPFNADGIPPEAVAELLRTGKVIKDSNGDLTRVFPPSASPDTRYEVSIKLDGSSMTAYQVIGEGDPESSGELVFHRGVCSRNFELKTDDEGSDFVRVFKNVVELYMRAGVQYPHPDILEQYALQGELCGPGIQGNQEQLVEKEFYIYNIFNVETGEFLNPVDRAKMVAALIRSGQTAGIAEPLRHVPIVAANTTLLEMGITNMAELLKAAEGPSMNPKVGREGLVFKAIDGTFQFKAISNKWLLAAG